MLQHINGGRSDGTLERRFQTYLRPDLLILDDFGLRPLIPPTPKDLYDAINKRYDCSPAMGVYGKRYGHVGGVKRRFRVRLHDYFCRAAARYPEEKHPKIVWALVDKVVVYADGTVKICGLLDGSEAAQLELGGLTNIPS